MATHSSLEERHQKLQKQYQDQREEVQRLRLAGRGLQDSTCDNILDDEATLFGFLRKHKEHDKALDALRQTIKWRKEKDVSNLTRQLVERTTNCDFFEINPQIRDAWNRPTVIVRLRHVHRGSTKSLDGLKKAIIYACECVRRQLVEASCQKVTPLLQSSILLDLQGGGLANFEVELFPFMLDLLRSQFPSPIAAIYVVNYTWLHGGLWSICKQLLPASALGKIYFAASASPLSPAFFAADRLPIEFGGSFDAGPEVMTIDLTEATSDDEFHECDNFYSAKSSRAPSRRPSISTESDTSAIVEGASTVLRRSELQGYAAIRPKTALRSVKSETNVSDALVLRRQQLPLRQRAVLRFVKFLMSATFGTAYDIDIQPEKHVSFAPRRALRQLSTFQKLIRSPKAYVYTILLCFVFRSSWLDRLRRQFGQLRVPITALIQERTRALAKGLP